MDRNDEDSAPGSIPFCCRSEIRSRFYGPARERSSAKLADRGSFDRTLRNLERQRGGSPRNANVKSDPRLRSLLRQMAEKEEGLSPCVPPFPRFHGLKRIDRRIFGEEGRIAMIRAMEGLYLLSQKCFQASFSTMNGGRGVLELWSVDVDDRIILYLRLDVKTLGAIRVSLINESCY